MQVYGETDGETDRGCATNKTGELSTDSQPCPQKNAKISRHMLIHHTQILFCAFLEKAGRALQPRMAMEVPMRQLCTDVFFAHLYLMLLTNKDYFALDQTQLPSSFRARNERRQGRCIPLKPAGMKHMMYLL